MAIVCLQHVCYVLHGCNDTDLMSGFANFV
jgi:hypothetical protein